MLTDKHWRLRAEEYRAIADSIAYGPARESYRRMALQCESTAHTLTPITHTPSTAKDCLHMAGLCDAFAESFPSDDAKSAISRVAERWRAMARDGRA